LSCRAGPPRSASRPGWARPRCAWARPP
jgi:hypothetical protein